MRTPPASTPLHAEPRGPSTALAIQLRSLHTLIPDPGNPRLHSERQVRQLVKSITTFGFCVPLLVDREGHVIAGHGRLLAAKQLGWSEVPTITLEHLSLHQRRAFALADNRLTDCSEWDERLLAVQLKELASADLDFDLDAIGFDMPEIDLRIQQLGEIDEEPEEAVIPTVDTPVVSCIGDVWHLGRHRIVCGSALEAASYDALQGQRAAMVFSDPPYNVKVSDIGGKGRIQHPEFVMASGEMSREAFTTFLSQAFALSKQHSKAGALLYIFMDWRHLSEITMAGEGQDLALKNLVVWAKGVGGMGSLYRSAHELLFVYKNGSAPHTNNIQLGRYGRDRTNVWSYPGANSFARETSEGNLLALHPTCKPVALVADAILDASERGDIVLDAFLGSGTTVIAAEKTGRVAYGIELDPKYVDVAVRRWQRLTGQQAVHARSGQPFEAVALERQATSSCDAPRCVEEGV